MQNTFKIYIASSKDFAKSEFRVSTTVFEDKYKLEKQLEKNYEKIKIEYMTEAIPKQQLPLAEKLLRERLFENTKIKKTSSNYNRRYLTPKKDLIDHAEFIASSCIEKETTKQKIAEQTAKRNRERIKRALLEEDSEFSGSEDEYRHKEDKEYVPSKDEEAEDPSSDSDVFTEDDDPESLKN